MMINNSGKLISTPSFSALYICTKSGEFIFIGCLDITINCEEDSNLSSFFLYSNNKIKYKYFDY